MDMMEVPWHYRTVDRIPEGVSLYQHIMDMQAWMIRNGTRVWCFNCLSAKSQSLCRCKLVDARGALVRLKDKIAIPHRIGTSCYYRCRMRCTAAPQACDLCIEAMHPVHPFNRSIDLSIWLECTRSGCHMDFHLPEGLESTAPRRLSQCPKPFELQQCRGPVRWLSLTPLIRKGGKFAYSIAARLRHLSRIRRQIFGVTNRELLSYMLGEMEEYFPDYLDEYLLDLYGIAGILHARQSCKAWKDGVTVLELMVQLRETRNA